jgi:hypothetical protein
MPIVRMLCRLHPARPRRRGEPTSFLSTSGSMIGRMRNAWMAVACAALAACGGDAAAAGPAVRDSAGIRIVQNTRPAWGEGDAWRVDAAPMLDLGVGEGDANYQFGVVADALRLSDGSVIVADGQMNEVRMYDAGGRYVRTIGRKGGGPGEFQGLWNLFLLPGDTVAAHDYMASRLTLFAPGGALARTVTLAPLDKLVPPRPLGIFADGTLVAGPMYNPSFEAAGSTPTRDTTTLTRYSAAGAQAGSLGRILGEESFSMVSGGKEERFAIRQPVPFGHNTVVVVSGTRMLVADNTRYELAEHTPDGRVTRLIRRDVPAEPVTDADRTDYLERNRPAEGDRLREMQERMLSQVPFPERKSAFQALRIDDRGNAWVQRHAPPDVETPWDVFDPDGRLLGTVPMPAGFVVTQIGDGFVVGIWKDEMDVQHVRVHRLHKPSNT